MKLDLEFPPVACWVLSWLSLSLSLSHTHYALFLLVFFFFYPVINANAVHHICFLFTISFSGFLHCKPSFLSSFLSSLSSTYTQPTNHFTHLCFYGPLNYIISLLFLFSLSMNCIFFPWKIWFLSGLHQHFFYHSLNSFLAHFRPQSSTCKPLLLGLLPFVLAYWVLVGLCYFRSTLAYLCSLCLSCLKKKPFLCSSGFARRKIKGVSLDHHKGKCFLFWITLWWSVHIFLTFSLFSLSLTWFISDAFLDFLPAFLDLDLWFHPRRYMSMWLLLMECWNWLNIFL